jgi:hypothetical protein
MADGPAQSVAWPCDLAVFEDWVVVEVRQRGQQEAVNKYATAFGIYVFAVAEIQDGERPVALVDVPAHDGNGTHRLALTTGAAAHDQDTTLFLASTGGVWCIDRLR